MKYEKKDLDLILVPIGILIMFLYHLLLLYKCIKLPHTTIIGYENNDKRAWVARIMEVDKAQVGTALTVIAANTSAATFLSSVSLTLSALIGAWISNSSGTNIFQSDLIYGNTSASILSIKYMCLLGCFLLAFAFFIQSASCFVHANYLISTPNSNIPIKNVQNSVIGGGEFWSLGLRALYFAIVLLLWFFGPIPMFVCSIVTVSLLYYLDSNSAPMHQHQSPTSQTATQSPPSQTATKTDGQQSSTS